MNNYTITKTLAILGPSIILRAFAMDILLPCIPAIATTFNAPFGVSQWILSIYFLAAGAGQFILGPLADEYGRRPILLLSVILMIAASIGCTVTNNIYMLIALRFVQGLGACGTTVVTMAIIRDVFDDNTTPKVYSYANSIVTLAPIFAPIIGGALLSITDDWRVPFYFVAGFSVVALLINYRFVLETNPDLDLQTGQHKIKIMAAYKKVLRNPLFLGYCFCCTSAVSCLFLFYSASSVLLIDILEVKPHAYGYYFAVNALAYLFGNLASVQAQKKLAMNGTIMLGSACVLLGGASIYIVDFLNGLSAFGLVLPTLLQTFGVGLLLGPCMAGAVKQFKHIAGIASACFGAILYGGCSLIAAAIMQIDMADAQVLGISIAIMGFLCLLLATQINLHSRRLLRYEQPQVA